MKHPAFLTVARLGRLAAVTLVLGGFAARAQTPEQKAQIASLKAACSADVSQFCGWVMPGGGRILACLQAKQGELSPACRVALPQAQALKDAAAASGQLPK